MAALFSVFFLGLWSSSTAGAVRNSWSQTAAGIEALDPSFDKTPRLYPLASADIILPIQP